MSDPEDAPLLELEVGSVAHGGHCVARCDGRVVFVRHALPGELVRARVTGEGSGGRFLRADAIEVFRPSPDRVEQPCPWAKPGRCGGCDWQHATLPAQRELKAAVVREALARIGHVSDDQLLGDLVVEEVPGAPDGLAWRTRVQYAITHEGRAGLRRHHSHEIEPIDRCLIADPRLQAVDVEHRDWHGAERVEVLVDDDSHIAAVVTERANARAAEDPLRTPEPSDDAGRTPESSGDAPTTRRHDGAHREPRRADDTSWTPEPSDDAPRAGRSRRWPIPDHAALLVTGRGGRLEPLRGDPTLHHVVDGREFAVAAPGFWQVHPGAAQALVSAVLQALDPRQGESAADLYGGAGLFAAALAPLVGEAGRVTLVEGDRRAAADAERNLAATPWARVVAGSVETALLGSPPSGAGARRGRRAGRPLLARADLVVLDPPRSGAGREVVDAICRLQPRRVAYVACDPAALARDIGYFARSGYGFRGLRAFDLFPMTQHVECVARLERG